MGTPDVIISYENIPKRCGRLFPNEEFLRCDCSKCKEYERYIRDLSLLIRMVGPIKTEN